MSRIQILSSMKNRKMIFYNFYYQCNGIVINSIITKMRVSFQYDLVKSGFRNSVHRFSDKVM